MKSSSILKASGGGGGGGESGAAAGFIRNDTDKTNQRIPHCNQRVYSLICFNDMQKFVFSIKK